LFPRLIFVVLKRLVLAQLFQVSCQGRGRGAFGALPRFVAGSWPGAAAALAQKVCETAVQSPEKQAKGEGAEAPSQLDH